LVYTLRKNKPKDFMKLSRRDKTVTAILVVIILILIYLMQCHFRNRFGARGDAKPVGEVEYKYHQVQRKLSDRMVWEEVDSKSPIYAYDWVMTKDKSDARITLNNGMKVDMDPESMVEIDETKSGVGLTLRDGTIRADSRGSKNASITAANGTKIDLDNANAQISSNGQNLAIDVKEGNAKLKTGDKEASIGAGEMGSVSSQGLQKEKTSIKLKEPATGAVFEGAPATVAFAFEAPNETKDCKIETTGNKKTRSFESSNQGTSAKFADGTHTWRVRCRLGAQNISSAIGAFRVRAQASIALLYPGANEVIPANRAQNLVLKWRGEGAVRIDVSANADFSGPIATSVTEKQSYAASNLKPGKYFWRVSEQGQARASAKSSFTVSDKGELLTENTDTSATSKKTEDLDKLKLAARSNSNITIEPDAEKGSAKISWSPVKKALKYRVRVSKSRDFSETIITREVSGQGNISVALKPGDYYYRVDAKKPGSNRSLATTLPQKISVARKKLPPPPRVKSVEAR